MSTCVTCGYSPCMCWYLTSLRPGGSNAALMPAVIEAMTTGAHPEHCPCPDCVLARDQQWLAGECSATVPVDPEREARWPR